MPYVTFGTLDGNECVLIKKSSFSSTFKRSVISTLTESMDSFNCITFVCFSQYVVKPIAIQSTKPEGGGTRFKQSLCQSGFRDK